jgi:hypothetical protein
MECLAKKEGSLRKGHVPLLNPVLLELCRDASWHLFLDSYSWRKPAKPFLHLGSRAKPNLRRATILRALCWIGSSRLNKPVNRTAESGFIFLGGGILPGVNRAKDEDARHS